MCIRDRVGVLKIGNDILFKDEKVKVDRITGHGGLFRTKGDPSDSECKPDRG